MSSICIPRVLGSNVISTPAPNRVAGEQLEIKINSAERRMDKMNKSLPSVIRNVVGHIEFAQPLDNNHGRG